MPHTQLQANTLTFNNSGHTLLSTIEAIMCRRL